jgi:4-aminobutyrate aminotransferase/(S)-3-amino-2-methylpropionate transaminase
MGRTGKMFAIEHFDMIPDTITFAKSVAAGMPLSGVVGKEEIMNSVNTAGIGTTFGGNPISCVAGLKNIEIIERNLNHAEQGR